MRFSTLVSLAVTLNLALAAPVQQQEGQSSIVQDPHDISKREVYPLKKRKICTKEKSQTYAQNVPQKTPETYVEAPAPTPNYQESSIGAPNGYQTTNDYEAPTTVAYDQESPSPSPSPSPNNYQNVDNYETPSSGSYTTKVSKSYTKVSKKHRKHRGGKKYATSTTQPASNDYTTSTAPEYETTSTGNTTPGGTTTGGNTYGDTTTGDTTTGDTTYGDSTTGGSTYGDTTTGGSTYDDTTTGGATYGNTDDKPAYVSTNSNNPSYNDASYDSSTYVTMPSGSSTGLKRGASVNNVGPDGTFMSDDAIKPYLVAAHNIARLLHEGTSTIVWDADIAAMARKNTASCNFAHTPSAARNGMGENIAYNTNASPEDQVLRQWYANEVVKYNFDNPAYSDGTGHMTAIVWKKVTKFGCAVRNCGSKNMGLYIKCNYAPTANVIGQYAQQVGRVKGASTAAQLRQIVEKATGFTPASTSNSY
ncbi:Helothermine [Drechslerella dactyloides]|uniref:Helothermine n=1 Tax=Drechslerella dactyloides TaxID=74499 RepID=A0AAD6NHP8_DREDA|nr:Helothermine [Drechslerella dactyloides]